MLVSCLWRLVGGGGTEGGREGGRDISMPISSTLRDVEVSINDCCFYKL